MRGGNTVPTLPLSTHYLVLIMKAEAHLSVKSRPLSRSFYHERFFPGLLILTPRLGPLVSLWQKTDSSIQHIRLRTRNLWRSATIYEKLSAEKQLSRCICEPVVLNSICQRFFRKLWGTFAAFFYFPNFNEPSKVCRRDAATIDHPPCSTAHLDWLGDSLLSKTDNVLALAVQSFLQR